MPPRRSSFCIWLIVVATALGPQLAAAFSSLQPITHPERQSAFARKAVFSCQGGRQMPAAASTSVSADQTAAEPWEFRTNPFAQAFEKLEEAAAAMVLVRGGAEHRTVPHGAVRTSFVSPALLRLAHDLAHVRLLI